MYALASSCRSAILSAVLGLCPAATLVAQAPPDARPAARLGVLLGMSSSQLDGQRESAAVPRVSSRQAVVAGGYATIPIGWRLAFQPELLYSPRGFRYRTGAGDFTLKMDYVEAPLLLRGSLPRVGAAVPYLYAGPAPALRARCAFTGGRAVAGVVNRISCAGAREAAGGQALDFRRVDLGAVVGGGLAVDIGGRALALGARYSQGLTPIEDPVTGADGGPVQRKHRVLSILTSIEFPIGR